MQETEERALDDTGYYEQGSEGWKTQRLGKITASRFSDMMTNGRGSSGSMGLTAYSYMYDLIIERLTGEPQTLPEMKALIWGNDHEPEARAMYCATQACRVAQVGFMCHPENPDVGGSPDGLIDGQEAGLGGVEIKCPFKSRIHLGYIEKGGTPSTYIHQVQGLMWITGRQWWDFVSYDPRMPKGLQLYVYREFADESYHKELEIRSRRFHEQMMIKLSKFMSKAT